MSFRTILLGLLLFPSSIPGISFETIAEAANGVTLFTPYTNISVPPGETINYTIEVSNDGSTTKNINIYVASFPKGWTYTLKAGGWNIKQLSVSPGKKETLSLSVQVPMKVNKGNYMFKVVATGFSELPLTINVSEEGTFKTEFTSDQANMEGNSKSSFTFRTKLTNQTGDKQLYSLRSDSQRGWQVTFKPNYKDATSVEIEPNNTKDINVDIKPPEYIKAGTYKIPVHAVTNTTSASLELEVVITGTYNMELTTPTGLLSTSITAGDEKRVTLIIKNNGSAELSDISLRASTPANWEVVFDPKKIDNIEAGNNVQVFATIKAGKKAIAGDYVTTLTASTPEVSSSAAFRISVKTPMLWGWVGILIIIVALGSVFYLFRKYGRR